MRLKARGAGVRYPREGNLGCPARAAVLKTDLLEHSNKLIRGKAVEK
jgi:hypothetical protein